MRFDSVGMFWEDLPTPREQKHYARPMPAIPPSDWKAPLCFPNLDSAEVLAIDTETYDPDLEDFGPGWARGKGHVVGVSIATIDGHKWYFPIRHETMPEDNLPVEQTLKWLKHTLENPKQAKVGANLLYDIGWLQQEGIFVKGDLYDVQSAEALLCERGKVGLDTLADKYLGKEKETTQLYKWLSDWFGGKPTDDRLRKYIYRAPPCLVGPYAEQDAVLPLEILRKQLPLLQQNNLLDLFRMECDLIPLMVAMRFKGVRVNIDRAEELRDTLLQRQDDAERQLQDAVGFKVEVNTADSLARAFKKLDLAFPHTATGKPSFTKDFLDSVRHPAAALIRQVRTLEKLRGTFIESYILDSHVNGRVHGQFHLLRGDSNGTRSGRLSSSTPNLQNIPSRDEELAPLVRGIYIPDEGHQQWRRYDYSQIEYRFLLHFAVGPGADEVREFFNANPETDYHDMILDLVAPVARWDISSAEKRKRRRKPIKNVNFGMIYGMGKDTLCLQLGLTKAEGDALFEDYHVAVPYAKATMEACSEEASSSGIITTILGRQSQFDLWEPVGRFSQGYAALPYDEALMRYGRVRRAFTHKALNRRLQGSAADMMKKAMWQCWKDGVFDATGIPLLTVHDELDFSDPGGIDSAFDEMHRIMETCIPLRVPVRVDLEMGPNWGEAK